MRVVGIGDRPAVTRLRVHRIVAPGEVAGRCLGIAVGQRGLELAAVFQRMVNLEEAFPQALVQFVPLGVDEGRAADVEQLAIGVGRQAESWRGVVALVRTAERQRGRRRNVVFQTTIDHRPLVLCVVDE
ncbi:hypothetical protein D3C80_1194340 [compost metagenome]